MGCVYKIFKGEFVYYGSTKDFKKRLINHKSRCYNKNDKMYNAKLYKTIRDNGGWDAFTKCIVEDIETEKEWKERENYYIRTCSCNMNTDIYISKEELRKRKLQRERDWYKNHKETVQMQKKEKIKCRCGRSVVKWSIKRHMRTPIHKKRETAGTKIIKFIRKKYNSSQ